LDFAWFPKSFPDGQLIVVGATRFNTDQITGLTLADYLLGNAP
jgi:hypothetical protein